MPGRTHALMVLVVTLLALCAVGCGAEPEESAFVARVGDTYLTYEEVNAALATLPSSRDSARAREQYVDQWVANQLLVREARRRNLDADPDVLRLLEDNERSVLVSALVNRIYELTPEPTASEIRSYFEQNRERLLLREPYVRIRILFSSDSLRAAEAREVLLNLDDAANPDSVWQQTVRRLADDPEVALTLSSNFYPESRLFAGTVYLRELLEETDVGEVAPIALVTGQYYALQIVERVSEGTLPRLEWLQQDISQRLMVQKRKQMYTDQVERLKNEALAGDELEIPD